MTRRHTAVAALAAGLLHAAGWRPAVADIPPPTAEAEEAATAGEGYVPTAGFVRLFQARFKETRESAPARTGPIDFAPLTPGGNRIRRNIPVILVDFEDQPRLYPPESYQYALFDGPLTVDGERGPRRTLKRYYLD